MLRPKVAADGVSKPRMAHAKSHQKEDLGSCPPYNVRRHRCSSRGPNGHSIDLDNQFSRRSVSDRFDTNKASRVKLASDLQA